MHVIACPLGRDVSLTLVSADGSTWRFYSWSYRAQPLIVRPSPEDQERGFPSAELATVFFKTRYDSVLNQPTVR